jgi:hypothetical protein
VNSLLNLTYEKLDRVLISTDMGTPSTGNNQPMFKFELGWLRRDGIMEMVNNVWDSVDYTEDSVRCWQ